jgi:hypothetical protein
MASSLIMGFSWGLAGLAMVPLGALGEALGMPVMMGIAGGFPLLSRYLRLTQKVKYVVPLGLYDHSGITMYVGGGTHAFDAQGWDSGTVGFAYIDPADVTLTGATVDTTDDAIEVITSEVKEYAQYLEGDVYGYVITTKHCDDDNCPHAEVIDGCWGFFGLDYVKEAARDAAAS